LRGENETPTPGVKHGSEQLKTQIEKKAKGQRGKIWERQLRKLRKTSWLEAKPITKWWGGGGVGGGGVG